MILAMMSDLGEKVPFEKPVQAAGGVEFWLNNLLNQVRETVRNMIAQMAQALKDPEYNFIVGFQTFPGQVKFKFYIFFVRFCTTNNICALFHIFYIPEF